MTPQLDSLGRLRHLLTLEGLDRRLIEALLDRADGFLRPGGALPARSDALAGRTVTNLFFEPSTRTRASFELAAKRLGADVLSLDVSTSSRAKGESLLDTIRTLQAMSVDIFVVRDAQAGVPDYIAGLVEPHVSILNAGESHLNHPTQGLLDVLTIRRHKGSFEGLAVAIVGDIQHSRVARSTGQALMTLGVDELRLVAPEGLAPDPAEFPGARFCALEDGLRDADVVMALRVQKERMAASQIPDAADYFRRFGLTPERMALAKDDAIVMHPGPMNRNVEISDAVADSPRSVIEDQVTNGLAVRMAVMETVIATLHAQAPAPVAAAGETR